MRSDRVTGPPPARERLRRLSGPARGSGDSPSTAWCRVSFLMLKQHRPGHPDLRVSIVCFALPGFGHSARSERAIGPSQRVLTVKTGIFEHLKAQLIPCGRGAVDYTTRRADNTTPLPARSVRTAVRPRPSGGVSEIG